MNPILCFVCLSLLLSCSSPVKEESHVVYPTDTWDTAEPSDFDINERLMLDALTYLESKSFEDGIEEVLIIKDGVVIYQGDSVKRSHNIWSCSKSFTSSIVGILVDRGIITLDDKVADYDKDLKEFYLDATFRHFVTMTSGYSAEGRSRWNDENEDWSYTPYTPEEPHFAPGTRYEYWDEAQMTLGKVLTRIIKEPLKDFAERELTSKIDMGEWEWYTEQEIDGIPISNGCTNIIVNAEQLGRFGYLFLNKGKWNGNQVISKEWCSNALSNQVPISVPVHDGDRSHVGGSGSYGYNWWVNSKDGLSRMPDAPLGVAYMSGLNHNVCAVIPEWNMVVIRMGTDKNPPEGKHVVWNEFLKRLGKALPEKNT